MHGCEKRTTQVIMTDRYTCVETGGKRNVQALRVPVSKNVASAPASANNKKFQL